MSARRKITKTTVDEAKPEAGPEAQPYVIWDTEIPGFGLKVHPTGRKVYLLKYRVGGGRSGTRREPAIGTHGALTPDSARKIAKEWAAVIAQGGDPGGRRKAYREAPTMAALFDRYLSDHARPNKKASSIAEDERLIAHYLAPAFGKRKVAEIARADVDRFHKGLAGKPYRANRALALLSKMMNLAEVWEMRPGGSNPCRHMSKFAEAQRKRFLAPAELARLGDALRIAEHDGCITLPPVPGQREKAERVPIMPSAVAAIRLLILTGARKSEILGLRWDWIDFAGKRANLPDSKTGQKAIILPPAALSVLAALPRIEGNPFVIAGGKPGAALVNLKDPWAAIREAAGIDDVRIHDLRHSFASVGAAGGASLPIIGALLGHSQPSTTARYAHLADDPLQAAAAAIGEKIEAAMSARGAAQPVNLADVRR